MSSGVDNHLSLGLHRA